MTDDLASANPESRESGNAVYPLVPVPVLASIKTDAESEATADFATGRDERNHLVNLCALIAHQTIHRIAWVFKTESVIVPAFVDAISGAGWVRGCLPVLNRLAQSVPSVMLAERLQRVRYKKQALLLSTALMGLPYLTMSVIWLIIPDRGATWLAPLFLLLFFLFFTVSGLNQLSYGTTQGKLIRVGSRGRLLGIAGGIGAAISVLAAWWLMGNWLEREDGGFGQIFAFAGGGFLIASLTALFLREKPDATNGRPLVRVNDFHASWTLFREDSNFRRLGWTTMLFVTVQLLFPHFQALGLRRPGVEYREMMVWVVAQNLGTGLFSMVAGAIADRWGNRLAVRLEILLAALTPLVAVAISQNWCGEQAPYWPTFFILGVVPLTYRTLVNYALELAPDNRHARYVSTLGLCMAIPFLLSPLVGMLTDVIGFQPVFVGVSLLVGFGGLLTFRMSEPRLRDAPSNLKA